MSEKAPLTAEEAPSVANEARSERETLDTMAEEAPSFKEDKSDDKETPLLPSDTPKTLTITLSGSKFFCGLCSSRLALIVFNVLSVLLYIAGFIAAMVSGHVDVSGQNAVAMVFNILFTLLILYGASKSDSTIVLVALLWELFIVIFGIVGATETFNRTDWSKEPKGTEKGTEAFIIITVLWQFLMIYTEAVFVYELRDMREEVVVNEEDDVEDAVVNKGDAEAVVEVT